MTRKCVLCGHRVGQGDRHAKGHCPPRPGKTGEHYARKQRRKAQARMNDDLNTKRGAAVAGTGVPKAGKKT